MPLPLKLNAFERYMLADDNAAYPMSFFVQVLFSGKFDKAAFVAALETALRRHPLLCARVASCSERELAWVSSPCPLPFLDCAGEYAPMRFPAAYRIDLREENGLRVWVRHGAARGVARFQFHHACCDGVAANQFIEDVLCAYDHEQCGSTGALPAFRPLDLESLRRRHQFGTGWRGWLWHKLVVLWGAIIGLMFFIARPASLHVPDPTDGHGSEHDEHTVPELLTRRFTQAQLDSLLATAKQSHVTLNDLMLRDSFLAMQAWNESGGQQQRQMLRILVPFNLRGPEHSRLPVANVMGMVNLDYYVSRFSHQAGRSLLNSIRRQTSVLKTFRVASAFACVMEILARLPGGLQNTLAGDRCLATMVLSNLGQVLADTPLRRQDGRLLAGNLEIEAVDTAPPIRAGLRIACTLYTYAGRLSLTMNYDRRAFPPGVARQLLDHIVAQIEQTAG